MIIKDENFEEILKNEKPVLVDFFATWCEPCSVLGPILEKVEKDMAGKFVLAKANLDDIPQTAGKFGVERIPTVVLFVNGQPVNGFVGLMQEPAIKEWLEKALKESNPADNEAKAKKILQDSIEFAEKTGIKLNPDKKTVDRIIKGLIENEKKYGKQYCPCRRVSGDAQEDEKKICPCVFHKEEIEKDGKCFCGLFVKGE